MANSTTGSGFDQLTQTYYNDRAQDRLVANFTFYHFCNKRNIPRNAGQTIQFYRFNNIGGVTSTIAEDTTTAGQVQLSAQTTSLTVAVYGQFITISNFALFTQRTDLIDAATDVLADSASDSVDQILRNNYINSATLLVAGSTAKTTASILSTDIATPQMLKYIRRQFQLNKVRQFRDGSAYIYVCGPNTEYDLTSDDTVGGFIQTHQYSNPKQILQNEIGKMAGFRIVVTPQILTTSVTAGVTAYGNIAIGENAQVCVDMDKNPIQIIAKEPGSGGTYDPYDNIATVAYKLPAFGVSWQGSDGPRAYLHTVAVTP